jgi:hypothetical protein
MYNILSIGRASMFVMPFFVLFLKHNTRPDQQAICTPKSSTVADGQHGFHLHTSGYAPVLADYWFLDPDHDAEPANTSCKLSAKPTIHRIRNQKPTQNLKPSHTGCKPTNHLGIMYELADSVSLEAWKISEANQTIN